MGRGGIARSNMLQLLRRSSSAERGVSKLIEGGAKTTENSSSSAAAAASYWVPHPRTGIYFPAGLDWVMEDVPVDAAKFTHTCWFRNVG